jgi:nitrogen regulatory protein PII 1
MKLIQAVVRPEKVEAVIDKLTDAGFPAYTKIDVTGRGDQEGVTVGEAHYKELTKKMLFIVVKEENKDQVIDIIMEEARTKSEGKLQSSLTVKMGEGNPGDGKIFVSDINEVYTISRKKQDY